MANQPAEKTFRIGNCSASVFKRSFEPRGGGSKLTLRSVVLQKSYLDGDQRKYTNSFDLQELPAAQKVLQMATDYVAGCEAETTG